MTITVLSDVILPESVLAAGVRGKQMRRNARATTQGGFASANVIWSRTLREFEVGYVPMLPEAWLAIEGLHEITDGGAAGFLMQDPKDHGVTHSNGALQAFVNGAFAGTSGVGYGSPVYKLQKVYQFTGSAQTKARSITRPKGTINVKRGGVDVAEGSGAGEIDVDLTTGIVTFEPDGSEAITGYTNLFFSAKFEVGTLIPGLGPGDYIYIDGMTGADSASVNGRSYLILYLDGDAYVVDGEWYYYSALDVSGSIYTYPKPSETLTWAGDFYLPVHFANDDIDWEILRNGPYDSRLISGPSVLLRELRE